MKDFLAVADYSPEDLQSILDTAIDLKKNGKTKAIPPYLRTKYWQ